MSARYSPRMLTGAVLWTGFAPGAGFVKYAQHRRGLVGWVEREGPVKQGDSVEIRIPEQALYGA